MSSLKLSLSPTRGMVDLRFLTFLESCAYWRNSVVEGECSIQTLMPSLSRRCHNFAWIWKGYGRLIRSALACGVSVIVRHLRRGLYCVEEVQ